MNDMKFGLFIPTHLVFGVGKLKNLSSLELPGEKALIVISSGNSMRNLGYLDTLLEQLKALNRDSVVFDKVLPNPIKEHVMQGAAICRDEDCDFVIGLGGGSSIDTAKAIAVAVNNEGDYWDYMQCGSGKKKPIGKVLPIVAIPTTAGTGTEIDPYSVITDTEKKEKLSLGDPKMFPTLSVVDPSLMVSIPAKLTAYQGLDAFFHAAEGYINSRLANPLSDMYALEAIRLLYKYLPVAVNDGNDIKARTKVAWASTLAGMVESTSSCISQHILEKTMSAFYPKLPHGAGLIAISKAYFQAFKNDTVKRYMKMAEKMTQQKSARPSDFIDALVQLQKACHVDNIKLSDWGITPADFDAFTQNAIDTGGHAFDNDPRFLTREEITAIYQQSYK